MTGTCSGSIPNGGCFGPLSLFLPSLILHVVLPPFKTCTPPPPSLDLIDKRKNKGSERVFHTIIRFLNKFRDFLYYIIDCEYLLNFSQGIYSFSEIGISVPT